MIRDYEPAQQLILQELSEVVPLLLHIIQYSAPAAATKSVVLLSRMIEVLGSRVVGEIDAFEEQSLIDTLLQGIRTDESGCSNLSEQTLVLLKHLVTHASKYTPAIRQTAQQRLATWPAQTANSDADEHEQERLLAAAVLSATPKTTTPHASSKSTPTAPLLLLK
jgi:hypothetical protein